MSPITAAYYNATAKLIANRGTIIHNDDGLDTVKDSVVKKIENFTDKIIFPAVLGILGIILVFDIVRAVMDYRRGDNVNFVPIIVLFIGLAALLALKASNLLWTVVGVN